MSAAVSGNAANVGSANSLALGARTTVTGNDVYFAVVLGLTTASVTSITNAGGAYSGVVQIAAKNGTGVRVELWKAHVTTGASTVFTANIAGGPTSIAFAQEEYSSVSSLGHNDTNSGNGVPLESALVQMQDASNFLVSAVGFACQSGDTLTVFDGRLLQSSIPAATAVAVAMYDNTAILVAKLDTLAKISTARNWACVSTELRSGNAANSGTTFAPVLAPVMQSPLLFSGLADYTLLNMKQPSMFGSAPSTFTPAPVGAALKGGIVGVAYAEAISTAGGTSPVTYAVIGGALPTSTSLNSSTGIISGTPTAAGTYTFIIQVTDANGYTGTQSFTIVIVAPVSGGGGGSFTFLN